jgi:transcriptional regulator of met regulon
MNAKAAQAPWMPYVCPEDACKSVQAVKAARDAALSARPWNYRKPRTTDWWLVPAHEEGNWPAYRFGKFHFGVDDAGAIELGLYAEKGLSVAAAKAMGFSANMVMTEDWLWHSFLRDIRSGVVAETAARTAKEAGLEAWVRVLAGVPLPPDSDLKPDRERVVFSAHTGEFVEASARLKDLKGVRNAVGPEALADALAKVGEITWVDILIGAALTTRDGAVRDKWDGERLWDRWLAPFMRWVR